MVSAIEGNPSVKLRVLEMGLVPGTVVRMERKAPMGDPVSVWFRGYELSLRKTEAEAVLINCDSATCSCKNCGGGCS